jgi:hypothetical protein
VIVSALLRQTLWKLERKQLSVGSVRFSFAVAVEK